VANAALPQPISAMYPTIEFVTGLLLCCNLILGLSSYTLSGFFSVAPGRSIVTDYSERSCTYGELVRRRSVRFCHSRASVGLHRQHVLGRHSVGPCMLGSRSFRPSSARFLCGFLVAQSFPLQNGSSAARAWALVM